MQKTLPLEDLARKLFPLKILQGNCFFKDKESLELLFVMKSAERLFATREGGTEAMGQYPGLISITPVHFVLLGKAGPEKGEPSLGMLSDMFRSVTATSHMKYAFSLYPLRK